jgi:Ca2+-binding RTX toxin-like protein
MRKPVRIDEGTLRQVTGGAAASDGGNTTQYGTNGADTMGGGSAHDLIFGGAGDDVIDGNAGMDWIEGGAGQDTIRAGDGADTIVWRPGEGNDSIDGGSGGHDQLRLPDNAIADLTVTLSDGTVVQPTEQFGNWGFWLPPGSSGTVTVGGETISFSGLEQITASDTFPRWDY